jgi:EAL and modified HD-GYP domain-containing signal transduction protein
MSKQIVVARQAVFDATEHVVGYELLHRTIDSPDVAEITSGYAATLDVIAYGIDLVVNATHKNQKLFINFPRRCFLEDQYLYLDKNKFVLEILETEKIDKEFLRVVEKAKSLGYIIAMDDIVRIENFKNLVGLLDYAKVDFTKLTDLDRLTKVSQYLQRHKPLLLAEKVETLDSVNFAKNLGYKLFQGFFFSKPQVIYGKALSPTTCTRLNLLYEMNKKNHDFDRIVNIISSDPILSFKLLKFVNSPFFGQLAKTATIKRAITVIGQKELLQWLSLVFLSEEACTEKDKELLYLSAFRARFLSLYRSAFPAICDIDLDMCLPGLFSLLDTLLGQPFEDIFSQIGACNEIREGLINSRSHCRKCLRFVHGFEANDMERIHAYKAITPSINIDRINLDAHMWASCIVR